MKKKIDFFVEKEKTIFCRTASSSIELIELMFLVSLSNVCLVVAKKILTFSSESEDKCLHEKILILERFCSFVERENIDRTEFIHFLCCNVCRKRISIDLGRFTLARFRNSFNQSNSFAVNRFNDGQMNLFNIFMSLPDQLENT